MLINENPRITDVLLYADGVSVNYVTDNVTVASGTVASPIGQVLGQITASGKFVQVNPSASDGSQNAAAVLLTPIVATLTADTTLVAVTRGPAILKSAGLAWTAGMTGTQITAALAQLKALGILTRTAYGV
jgi:hypothetical protein